MKHIFVVLLENDIIVPWCSILLTSGKINSMVNSEQHANQFSRLLRFRIIFAHNSIVFLIMSDLN